MRSRANRRGFAVWRLAAGWGLLWAGWASAAVNVTVSGPGGSRSQALPDDGGQFDVDLPLNRNSLNTITVTAADANGNQRSQDITITQLSLDEIVVSKITTERLPPERVIQLVNDGVIDLEDPENFNVSEFFIVLTIGKKPVTVSVPVVTPISEPTGTEVIPLPRGGGGSAEPPKVQDTEIILFEVAPPPGSPAPPVPGVIIIEGRIKSLKEFFSVRLLLMNTSGIFTLQDVQACLQFPDGGLSHTLPANGMLQFGDILPGDGGTPGQKEREFIVRGDEIGVRGVQVDFAGTISGPGIPDDDPIPFSGSAVSSVEVKGPPSFLVRVDHPDYVVKDIPYNLVVEITNTGDLPALYASLELSVGAAAELVICSYDEVLGEPVCTNSPGPEIRSFGHIFPGETVREVFQVNPLDTGPITSCLGVSDQNITLQVDVGVIGCLTGHFPPEFGNLGGTPSVSVVPTPNTQGANVEAPVVAFFSELMNERSILAANTFRVFDGAGQLVPGKIFFEELNGRTIAVWQPVDGISNRLLENSNYTVVLTQGIKDLEGNPLFSEWSSTFTTTSTINDITPPELTLSILPPTNPNLVIPGEQIVVNAYAVDQGSGIGRVELRRKDITVPSALYEMVDQKTVHTSADLPVLFTVGTAGLVPGHAYQLKGTAYDRLGNVREATIAVFLAASAAPPTIVLPPDATNDVLRGISVALTPVSVSRATTRVVYTLDDAATPVATSLLAPYSAHINTLSLPIGAHTVTAVAVDGLLQTGSDQYAFTLAENLNEPQISFIGTASGDEFVTGSVVAVNAQITDPVGLDSVKYYFDTIDDPPIYAGSQPFAINTTGLAIGNHKIIVVARNKLGIQNNPDAPSSFLAFDLIDAPPGPPPSPPAIDSPPPPDASGQVHVSGTTIPHATVTIQNQTQGLTITVAANAAGAFTASMDAVGGDTLRLTATDLHSSPLASAPVTVIVPNPPVLVGLTVSPAVRTFTARNQVSDLTVTAQFAGGGSSGVTGFATFSSSAPAVASVNAAGRVVANSRGSAVITASYGGMQAPANITVDILELTGLTVDPEVVVLVFTGQTQQVSVTAQFSDGSTMPYDADARYALSDAGVVTVSRSGLLTAVGEGDTQVYITTGALPPVSLPVSVITGLNPPPMVQVTSPADGARVERGDVVPVQVRADDPTGGVIRVSLDASGEASLSEVQQVSPPAASAGRVFSLRVPDTAAIGGTIRLVPGARDAGGLTASGSPVTLQVVDETPPQVALVTPEPDSLYNAGDTVIVTVSATDAVGLEEIGYQTDGALVLSDSTLLPSGTTETTRVFQFVVPAGAPSPDVYVYGLARDAGGNTITSAPVRIELTGADITPPETEITAISNPGAGPSAAVTYTVLDGLDDLDHVELYWRRNGIGTFNRYIDPTTTNLFGRFLPQSGDIGAILFDSTRMGGDGAFEFYTVGVDQTGNREAPPDTPDAETPFTAGTVFVTIASNRVISAADTTLDNVNLRIVDAEVTLDGVHTFQNLELLGTARVTHASTTLTNEPGFELRAWTLSVASNASVNVDGRGYLGGGVNGNGHPGDTLGFADGASVRSGGSYGGLGGQFNGTPNAIYGNLVQPTDLGSGGSSNGGTARGGNGGGRIRIDAIHVAADGAMQANGTDGGGFQAGSGSGGSIFILTHTLSGRGLIAANGGRREVGGGGGRIGIHYTDLDTKDTGLIGARGGVGSSATGGNGTVYLKSADQGSGTLVVDGEGVATTFSGLPIPQGVVFDNLIIRNNARVVVDDPIVVNDTVQVLNDSVLTHSVDQTNGLQIQASNVLIDATSTIDVSGKGYRGGRRDGNPLHTGETLHGQPGAAVRAAGSYGGLGGIYSGSGSNLVYGMPWEPVHLGSGGSGNGGAAAGGNGGGRVDIQATGSVTVDGAILADGQTGSGFQSGSGSGGSIRIGCSLLRGTGRMSAAGGAGEVGGGGGRIAVRYAFLGAPPADLGGLRDVGAFGGKGISRVGSAGTVYVEQAGRDDLYFDEGLDGTTSTLWTPLTPLGPGRIQSLTTNELVLDGAVPVLPGGLAGLPVRPNLEAPEIFTVIDNTATSLTVDVSGGVMLTDVASPGDVYAAAYAFDNVALRRGAWVVCGDPLAVSGELTIAEQSALTHPNAALDYEPGLDITAGRITVAGDGVIDVSGRGYLGGGQDGNGHPGRTLGNTEGASPRSGGSYGGIGGAFDGTPNPTYGDLTAPVDLGAGGSGNSGSALGGNGGGRIHLSANTVQVDGRISANGNLGSGLQSGSGAGGSIFIQAGALRGPGMVQANGGMGEVGGGGGRIATHYSVLDMDPAQFEAFGGQGSTRVGGNGTLFFKSAVQVTGKLIIDGGNTATPPGSTPIPGGLAFDELTLRNQADVVVDQPLSVTGAFRLLGNSRLTHPQGLEAGLRIDATDILVDETSSIDVSGMGYRGGRRDGNTSHSGETLFGQLGALPRSAGSYGGLGGIFGGSGSNLVYGTPQQPTYLGAGGSSNGGSAQGGNGGGRVTLNASGAVTVDGTILADGQTGSGFQSGSGAGGSIQIDCTLLQGAGRISAAGGGGEVGGGGGRIACYYQFLGAGGNDFSGLRDVTAVGGKGSQRTGSAGTVYWKQGAQAYGDLYLDEGLTNTTSSLWTPLTTIGPGRIVDLSEDALVLDGAVDILPGGLAGTQVRPNLLVPDVFTIVDNTSTTITVDVTGGTTLTDVATTGDVYAASYLFDHVRFRRGAFMVLGDLLTVTDELSIEENGVLTHFDASLNYEPFLDITAGRIVVSTNSQVNVNGRGYLGGGREGNGHAGRTLGNQEGAPPKSAGSHGGLGGSYSADSNPVYGDVTAPLNLGAGGSSNGGTSAGGDGGGRVRLTADTVQVDGTISANGLIGSGFQAGSGAGGSIYIVAGIARGAGTIQANGGPNEVGGGGGRIAVHYGALDLDPSQFQALGGQGNFATGGNGTLFLRDVSRTIGDLFVDGHATVTPSDSSPIPVGVVFDNVVFRGGARATLSAPLIVQGAVEVLGDSAISHAAGDENGIRIEADTLLIETGSVIDATARGYPGGRQDGNDLHQGLTTNATPGSTARSGGSYGGLGGNFDGQANPTYGEAENPVFLGSGGSSNGGTAKGGNGGGRITLIIDGAFTLDGGLHTDGGGGNGFQSGGGSGGSILVEAGTLDGMGTMTADGGGTEVGGGGGRIAVYSGTLNFDTNSASANGGAGNFVPGGDGTVRFIPGSQPAPIAAVRAPRISSLELLESGQVIIRWSDPDSTGRWLIETGPALDELGWDVLLSPVQDTGWTSPVPADTSTRFFRIRRE